MPRYIYELAADILRQHGGAMHYTEIARRIKESEDSMLGKRGRTPEQTVGALLRAKRRIFKSMGDGYYDLVEKG